MAVVPHFGAPTIKKSGLRPIQALFFPADDKEVSTEQSAYTDLKATPILNEENLNKISVLPKKSRLDSYRAGA